MKIFLTNEDIWLFNKGKHFRCYLKFGAHRIKMNHNWGVHFALWAPNAKSVKLAGDFNGWNGSGYEMNQNFGIWSLFVPELEEGELYKYEITTGKGKKTLKSDPFAFYSELRPQTASIVHSLNGYRWGDDDWMKNRDKALLQKRPISIYEVHLGSWKRKHNGALYTYNELAKELIPYAQKMGFTHLELLPLMEHPFDGSWGYQTTGYFSTTSRYGKPQELMHFVDCCHQANIGVILDWVPGHFCRDTHGLGRFDGEMLYERADHPQWGTYEFDLAKPQVHSFLISNAFFWLDKFHFDGLRVDGVTSMLYFDHLHLNAFGNTENQAAIYFLKTLNEKVNQAFPQALMIAEESSAWAGVTKPVSQGGLGFDYKWNMGWMNDTLRYFAKDFKERHQHHHLLTFSLHYAFSENFILPLSHDEVVHGKKSLLDKMPGDYWQKFAGLKTLYSFQLWHPGKKLLFMGGEIAQFIEWRYYEEVEWFLLAYPSHSSFHNFVSTANHLYLREKSLWQNDINWDGFQWLDVHNHKQSILIFLRKAAQGEFIICLLNLTPNFYPDFKLGVPTKGKYFELFNSDESGFGGSGQLNKDTLEAKKSPMHGQSYSLNIKLPPLAGILIKPIKT
jgi:1,4-alpha-glucan branching enzyme